MFESKITNQKNTKAAMDEIMSMVLDGCKLAKELESKLPTMASEPSLIGSSCDEIVKVFSSVRDRLMSIGMLEQRVLYHHQMGAATAGMMIDPSNLQEFLRSSATQAMELFHHRQGLADQKITPFEMVSGGGGDYMEGSSSLSRLRGTTGADVHVHVPLMEVSVDSSAGRGGGGGSTSQRSHRRRENARVMTVPAPRYGNMEIPPEDGYTWRKYGQKEILNSRFPRSYYRCTHQKLYNCPAKKQVQRLDNDPYTFEVTYNGEHTCHMSSTAPSAAPSVSMAVPPDVTQEMTQITIPMQPSPTSILSSTWLSMQLGTVRSGSGSSGGGVTGGGSSSRTGPSSSSGARYDREGEHQYVANMADAMFNSGSSSSNSMEFLFQNMEDQKWQPDDKKN